MTGEERRFQNALARWFLPGAAYTFVGAGGKTTAMKRVAVFLAAAGMKVRMTTTTRVGVEELSGTPVTLLASSSELASAMAADAPVGLLVGGILTDTGKYQGIDARLIEGVTVGADTVLLVEGDGARRRPMKAPRDHEPFIPANTRTVFAVMGAGAIDEPIDEEHCYNHDGALSLTGKPSGSLDPETLAALSADPRCGRKGVLPGMGFRLLINQGDLAQKRVSAIAAIQLAGALHGISGALVSMQKGELYAETDD